MGNWFTSPPPPVVLVPPLLDGVRLASRYRMAKSSYDVLFSKMARRCLFEDYYVEADQLMGRIMLKPSEDPRVDFTATIYTPLMEGTSQIKGDAVFHFQRDALDPNSFVDFKISSYDKALQVQACIFYPEIGFGAYGIFPLLLRNRDQSAEGHSLIGLRYASNRLSVGTTVAPSQCMEIPRSMWLVGRVGQITAGCQYQHLVMEEKQRTFWGGYRLIELQDPSNWSFAVDYGARRKSPLNPSFNFCVEISNNSKLTASYYHHLVVQRTVKNPFESDHVAAITNYIDLGFEFQNRLDRDATVKTGLDYQPSNMQIGGSWQANKNLLFKAKLGTNSSAIVLIFKSWWQPSFTISCAVVRDHLQKKSKFGIGIQVANFGDVRYIPNSL
eukprot:c26342_g1_i2 orf=36-1190(+)